MTGSAQDAVFPDLPRCEERPAYRFDPRVVGAFWCLEEAIAVDDVELAFTALTFDPSGTLYAARPITGEIYTITDTNGDLLPDAATLLLDGLTLPQSLYWHDESLYIAAGPRIHRYRDGELVTLIDDLPYETGFTAHSLLVSPDDRLLVGISAPCDYCTFDADEHGIIASYALDGTDRQVIARGLRYPAAMTFRDGELWVTDSARDGLVDQYNMDEINRVTDGDHFGFPHCTATGEPDTLAGDFDCAAAVEPVFRLPTHSVPVALRTYQGEAFTRLNDQLIVVMRGSSHRVDLRGYEIIAIDLDAAEHGRIETIAPVDVLVAPASPVAYQPEAGYFSNSVRFINQRYGAFFPNYLYDLAISPEGWLYFSWGGDKIMALRTGDFINVGLMAYFQRNADALEGKSRLPAD